MGILGHFGTENCIWLFLSDFSTNVRKYIILNAWNNLGLVIIQNISRPKCFNTVWHMKT